MKTLSSLASGLRRASDIRDVARRARVSAATVSRALNGSGLVAPRTAARIQRAAAALGYRVNAVGRSLVTARTRVLGVMVPTLTNPVFAGSVTGLTTEARRAGYEILLAASDYDASRELEVVETFLSQRVEGLALTLTDPDGPVAALVAAARLPLALLYNVPKGRGVPHVAVDDRAAADEMVTELIRAGHRRVAMIAGHFAASDRSRRRYDGYLAAMCRARLAPRRLLEVPFLGGNVRDALQPLLDGPGPPTAFFCSNDLLALAVIDAARQLGLAVPRDLSVAGFDGIEVGRLVRPRLATVVQPTVEMGRAAGELVFAALSGARVAERRLLPYEIYLGETIAPHEGGHQ
jgi:DNA-binding LacI/PurR family transcriptional regulator